MTRRVAVTSPTPDHSGIRWWMQARAARAAEVSKDMRSTNPVLSRPDVFSRGAYGSGYGSAGQASRPMTMNDVVERTSALLLVAAGTGAVGWFANVGPGLALAAALVGLVLGMITQMQARVNPVLAFAYAAVEGVFLGAVSRWQEQIHPGVVVQAVAGTGVTFFVMLALYRSGRVRLTPRFQKVLVGASLGYLVLMLGNLLLRVFDHGFNPWHSGLGLLTSAFAAGMASLFLTMDFDMVERGIRSGAPESEAWRAAFGLTVTLIWLYVELLRLLSNLRN